MKFGTKFDIIYDAMSSLQACVFFITEDIMINYKNNHY